MIILGVDPGLERIGYGVIEKSGSQIKAIDYGLIKTPKVEIGTRLKLAHDQFAELLVKTKPDHFATERLFFAKNQTTAFDVAKALGVVLLAASEYGLAPHEYSPPEVKQSVVGNGAADKKQVQFMVTRLLGLKEAPKPDDVADALAVAITHAMRLPLSGVVR